MTKRPAKNWRRKTCNWLIFVVVEFLGRVSASSNLSPPHRKCPPSGLPTSSQSPFLNIQTFLSNSLLVLLWKYWNGFYRGSTFSTTDAATTMYLACQCHLRMRLGLTPLKFKGGRLELGKITIQVLKLPSWKSLQNLCALISVDSGHISWFE